MKTFLAVVIAGIIIAGGWYWYSKNPENKQSVPDMPIAEENEKDLEADLAVREISLSAKNFEFSEKEIRVKKGERIRINLSIEMGTHDWVVDEFGGARTAIISMGKSSSAEFVASEIGIFEYYCSVGTHRQMGMVGKLIVE